MRLDEIGERRIIDEVLVPFYRPEDIEFGDDCGVYPLEDSKSLLITTDPCPLPMAWQLGYNDYYYAGWLLATINLSDIASMGGTPIGMVTSYILPPETEDTDLRRMITGLNDCCAKFGCKILGGNLKESPFLSLSATAFGLVENSHLMRRKGAIPGDRIVIIGDIGNFWAGYFKVRNFSKHSEQREDSGLLKNILTPEPKINEGLLLAKHKLLSCCMDNSDGLHPSLQELASINQCTFHITPSIIKYPVEVMQVADSLGVDPFRFVMGWGDWQLIGTISEENLVTATDCLAKIGSVITEIGNVSVGSPEVTIALAGKTGLLYPLDSERFTKTSWFTVGIESYVERLLNAPLLTD